MAGFKQWLLGQGIREEDFESTVKRIEAYNQSLPVPYMLAFGGDEVLKRLYGEMSENPIAHQDVLCDMMVTIANSQHIHAFNVKGMFLLGLVLQQAGALFDNRKTRDLDFDVLTHTDWESFVSEMPNLFTVNSRIGAVYTLKKRRGYTANANGDSLVFTVMIGGQEVEVRIDMNVKEFEDQTLYTLGNTEFYGASVYAMLADKLSACCSRKVYRRVKDVYDIYTMSLCLDIKSADFFRTWDSSPRVVDKPCELLAPDAYAKLEHAFKVYQGFVVNKDDFSLVYERVVNFLDVLLIGVYAANNRMNEVWLHDKGVWVRG